jgi:peptidoglycan/LPS O-acetylase OafA/YrhL
MRREIRSHTGLRGVAALLVVGYHQQFGGGYRLPLETGLFRRSYLMVDLFFILSGFVLSYVYNAERPLADARAFFRARFARIFPLHVFALMTFTAVVVGKSSLALLRGHAGEPLGSVWDWLSQLLLLNAWIPATNEWNKPSWSISAEAFAYLIYPMILAVHAVVPRMTQIVLFAVAAFFYCLVGSSLDISVGLAPLRCIAGFSVGMLLFYHRDLRVPARSALQVAAVLWIVFVMFRGIADPFIIPGFAALIFLTWTDEGLVARMLSANPVHWLGNISYSVYLMHYSVGAVVWFIWVKVRSGIPEPIERITSLALIFGSAVAVAHLTYRYVEKSAQRWLLRRRPTQAETAVAAP